MAENEYLEAASSGRWLPLQNGIVGRCHIAELTRVAFECLVRETRALWKTSNFGVLASCCERLPELVQTCGRTEGAIVEKDYLIEASQGGGESLAILERFFVSLFQQYLYDVPYDVSKRDDTLSISEIRAQVASITENAQPLIRNFALRIADAPQSPPRISKRLLGSYASAASSNSTKSMLSESLLKRR